MVVTYVTLFFFGRCGEPKKKNSILSKNKCNKLNTQHKTKFISTRHMQWVLEKYPDF